MFLLFKHVLTGILSFSESLASVFEDPDRTKCIYCNNQPCITELLNLNFNCQGLHYYILFG